MYCNMHKGSYNNKIHMMGIISYNNKIHMMGIISKLCNERYHSSGLCFFEESVVLDIRFVSFWCITSD